MGLLDDLKKQADDLKAKDTDRTESMRSTAVAVDHALIIGAALTRGSCG